VTSKALIPQAFWFRFSVPAPRIEGMPTTERSGKLLGLPPSCALPDFRRLEGQASWVEVRVGWNTAGIGLTVLADGVSESQLDPGRPEGFADVQIWVNTRDTRDVQRATRFCHRFAGQIRATRSKDDALAVQVSQKPIARAVADAPLCRAAQIPARAAVSGSGWTLEVFLPASVLNGFDVDANRRFGFAYQVSDHVHEDQFLGVGRDFPIGENPSLWATLELID
jgi:hypothetical protein